MSAEYWANLFDYPKAITLRLILRVSMLLFGAQMQRVSTVELTMLVGRSTYDCYF